MEYYQALWEFVGKELGLGKIKAKALVKDLSEEEFLAYLNRDVTEIELTHEQKRKVEWETHEGENEAKRNLEYLQEELNAQVFCRKMLEQMPKQALNLIESAFPEFKTCDILILVRTKNIPKRQEEWSKKSGVSLSYNDVREFLIIHEMIDAYSRLAHMKISRGSNMDYDKMASKIWRKWKG